MWLHGHLQQGLLPERPQSGGSGRPGRSEWQKALADLRSLHVPLTVAKYGSALIACKRGLQWEHALSLLRWMEEDAVAKNEFIFTHAILVCMQCGHATAVLKLLGDMPVASVPPNNVVCAQVISQCHREHNWHLSMQIFSKMMRSSARPDVITFTSTINACEKGQQWEAALQLFNTMRGMASIPNELTCSAVVQSLKPRASAAAGAGTWRLLPSLLHEIRCLGVQRDVVFSNSVNGAVEEASEWRTALVGVQSMLSSKLELDAASSSVVIKAFGSPGLWQRGLFVLGAMPINSIAINTAIGICSGIWQQALWLCSEHLSNAATYTAAISACRHGGKWEVALSLLQQMQCRGLSPGTVTVTAAITCCEASRQWQQAVGLLSLMLRRLLEVDAIAYRCTIGSCDVHWQHALAILMVSWQARVYDTESFTRVLWCFEAVGCWQSAQALLHNKPESLVPDESSYLSVIRSCGNSGEIAAGFEVLHDFVHSGIVHGVAFLPCAMSALFINDPDLIRATFAETWQRLRKETWSPCDLITLWSALGSMGARNAAFENAILAEALPSLCAYDWDELMELSWGAAACGMASDFFDPLQEEVLSRFGVVADPPAQCILGLISACHAAGSLRASFNMAASQLLERRGKDLDGQSTKHVAAEALPSPARWLHRSPAKGSEPTVVLQRLDMAILMKPAGWEVFGDQSERQLSAWIQARFGLQQSILRDSSFQFGFLHRLDVPSSGLVCVATTYAKYYALELQLRTGLLNRDYFLVSYGWWPLSLLEIRASLHWGLHTLSIAGGRGKPSASLVKVLAHAERRAQSAHSLLAVRIVTGRRHQIRSHLAHVGHPVVSDGQYAATAMRSTSDYRNNRHFLHRYRLEFLADGSGGLSVLEPLSPDLLKYLKMLRGKDARSSELLQAWMHGDLGDAIDWQQLSSLSSEDCTHVS
ncbi:EMB2654 [Symbiodinium sp. CCMP2592]|nr:EMB2654 [Symbiodinium sp. CCMP2592]